MHEVFAGEGSNRRSHREALKRMLKRLARLLVVTGEGAAKACLMYPTYEELGTTADRRLTPIRAQCRAMTHDGLRSPRVSTQL